MSRSLVLFLVILTQVLAQVRAGAWGRSSLWNDGRAEVAIYDSERIVYDLPRKFQETLLIVKEDLREDTLVKADDPKKQKTIRVFKLNQIQKFDTQNYPYSYLTSVFVKDDDLQHVVKLTVGSQEWCGNTFKMYSGDPSGKSGKLNWSSYFDGEADQSLPLEGGENVYFEEQLPLSLRAISFKVGMSEKIRVWDFLSSNRGVAPQLNDVLLTVESEEIVRGRVGSLPSWKVVLHYPNGDDIYWFEKADPHILTKMITRDGRKRLLYGRARWSYWDRRLPKPNVLK